MIEAKSHSEVKSYLPPLPGYRAALAVHAEMVRNAAESVSVPLIASPGSVVSAWVIPTDENLMIARHTRQLLDGEGPR